MAWKIRKQEHMSGQKRFRKVAVLMGGPSSEREVSLRSGAAVVNALRGAGYEVCDVRVGEDARFDLPAGVEAAFVAMHGKFGEDGTVQRLLRERGIPHTGSSPEACARSFDKSKSKPVIAAAGIPTPDGKEAGGFAVLDMADFQGTSVMNECDGEVPWTRTHEFKHFTPELSFERTVIFREYSFDPGSEDDLYYPVRTAADLAIHAKYIKEAAGVPHVHFGGRPFLERFSSSDETPTTKWSHSSRERSRMRKCP